MEENAGRQRLRQLNYSKTYKFLKVTLILCCKSEGRMLPGSVCALSPRPWALSKSNTARTPQCKHYLRNKIHISAFHKQTFLRNIPPHCPWTWPSAVCFTCKRYPAKYVQLHRDASVSLFGRRVCCVCCSSCS